MAQNIKVMVSCDVVFCNPSGTYQGFRGTYCLLQKASGFSDVSTYPSSFMLYQPRRLSIEYMLYFTWWQRCI